MFAEHLGDVKNFFKLALGRESVGIYSMSGAGRVRNRLFHHTARVVHGAVVDHQYISVMHATVEKGNALFRFPLYKWNIPKTILEIEFKTL